MDAIERFYERRKLRLDVADYARRKEKRKKIKDLLDKFKNYDTINLDDEEEGSDGPASHGNTRIPFGLCKAADIDTKGMSPYEAWQALEDGFGITATDVYKELKKTGTVTHLAPGEKHSEGETSAAEPDATKKPESAGETKSFEKPEFKESEPVEKEAAEKPEAKKEAPAAKEPKIAFDDPESVALYKQLKAGEYLPMEKLLAHPSVKKLEQAAKNNIIKYGETWKNNTPERIKLRGKIKHDYLKTGSAVVTEKDGKKQVTYDGPLKKEFKACLVIGRAASGKSSQIVEPYSAENGAFVLDPDRISEEFPEYKETNGGAANCVHRESQDMLKSILSKKFCDGHRRGTNLIYPFVGGYVPYVKDTITMLENAGYEVEVRYQDSTAEESANRMVMRGLETGRITPIRKETGWTPKDTMEEIRKWKDGKYVKS